MRHPCSVTTHRRLEVGTLRREQALPVRVKTFFDLPRSSSGKMATLVTVGTLLRREGKQVREIRSVWVRSPSQRSLRRFQEDEKSWEIEIRQRQFHVPNCKEAFGGKPR